MSRSKKGVNALKTRRNVLRRVKGYRFGRSKKERQAREAIAHAGTYAFAHRKDKKGDFRRLWTVRLNAAVRQMNHASITSYSKLIAALKKKGIALNRKMLSDLAANDPAVFAKVVDTAG